MIDMTKQYRTRDGRKVRVLANDVNNKLTPVVAVVGQANGEETALSYTAKGEYYLSDKSDYDLVEYNPEMDLVLDQAIWVSLDGEYWYPRHFAKHKGGEVFCWHKGATSHTCLTGSDSWAKWSATKPEDTK